MKKNLILCSCLALLLGACKKDHDNDAKTNTWTFNGTTYTAATVVYVDAGPQANLSAAATGNTATSGDGLTFLFVPPPTTSGLMLISDTGDPNTIMVSHARMSNGSTDFYVSGETDIQANVTVNGGKVSVSFPGSIWLNNMSNYDDSAQISVGTITQQ